MGIEAEDRNQIIKTQIPLVEMYKYATSLKSLTHGQEAYGMNLSHYEEAPSRIT